MWNYDEECVQVFQFHQQGIAAPIIEALSDEEIEAEPTAYDFIIKATGWTASISATASPRCPVSAARPRSIPRSTPPGQEVTSNGFDLKALLMGGDPFKPSF